MNKLNINFLQLNDRKLAVLSNDLSNIIVRIEKNNFNFDLYKFKVE